MDNQLLDDQLENITYFDKASLVEISKARNIANQLIQEVRGGKALFIVLSILTLMLVGLGAYKWHSGNEEGLGSLLEGSILFVIYASCALFFKKKPLAILIIGFSIYVFIFIIGIVIYNDSLLKDFIMRILIIYYFIKSIKAAAKLPAALDTLNGLRVPSHWFDLAKDLKDLPLSESLLKIDDE